MRRFGSCVSTAVGFSFFALLLALLVGPAITIEVWGVNVSGVVAARHERISVQAGIWNRQLQEEIPLPRSQVLVLGAAYEPGQKP